MKTIYTIFSILVLAIAFTACQDEKLFEPNLTDNTNTGEVVIYASTGAATRLLPSDSGNQISFMWQEGDKFIVFNGSEATEFTVNSSSITSIGAYFTGTPATPFKKGDVLNAVFNPRANADNNYLRDADGNMLIDISDQNGKLNENFNYLFSQVVYDPEILPDETYAPIPFIFQNLVTMLRVTVPKPNGFTSKYDRMELINGNDRSTYQLAKKAKLVLSNPIQGPLGTHEIGTLASLETHQEGKTSESIAVNSFEEADEFVTAYFYVLPVECYHILNQCGHHYNRGDYYLSEWEEEPEYEPDFIAYSGNDTYIAVKEYGVRRMLGGKTFGINTPMRKVTPFQNEASVSGEDYNVTYEIANADQLYTLMLRAKADLKDAGGRYYRDCNYSITQDIDLNEDIEWTSICLNNASFSGNGHTISGKLFIDSDRNDVYTTTYFDYRMPIWFAGLLGEIQGGTVRDIVMTANLKVKGTFPIRSCGIICAEAYSTDIKNCHVFLPKEVDETFQINANFTGGIVGRLVYGSVEGCSVEGTLGHNSLGWHHEREIQIGGIAGMCDDYCQIKACYTDIHINAAGIGDSDVSYYGGIVGHGHTYDSSPDNACKITDCWSNYRMTIGQVSSDHVWNPGGISGYLENGVIDNCYWHDIISAITNDTSSTISSCTSFSDDKPTPTQIDNLNRAIAGSGYLFNANGRLESDNRSSIDPFEKEQW